MGEIWAGSKKVAGRATSDNRFNLLAVAVADGAVVGVDVDVGVEVDADIETGVGDIGPRAG